MNLENQFVWSLEFFGGSHQLIRRHGLQAAHSTYYCPHVTHSFYNVTGSRFALGANHSCAFADSPEPAPDPRIRLLGFVADVRPLYVESNLIIVPTTVSAGILSVNGVPLSGRR